MKRLFFQGVGFPGVAPEQLNEMRDWHRAYGLVLGLGALTDAVVHIDGKAGELVTQLLRLAAIGAEAEAMMRAGVDGKVSDLVADRDVLWKAGIR